VDWSFSLRPVSTVEKSTHRTERRSPISKALHLTEIKNVDFCPVSKADEWRRIVRAIILKPGQKYSREEIRLACYNWMENIQKYNGRINGAVKILENMIVPVDMKINDSQEVFKAGTWIIVLKILSKSLWREFQSGAFHIAGENVQEI